MQQKLADFMRGRNGLDDLSLTVLRLALILFVIDLVFLFKPWIITLIIVLLVAYSIFRMVSLNIGARRQEAKAFIDALGPAKPYVLNPIGAVREAMQYKHLSCPNCQKRVRVPRGKGRVRVTCPDCHQKFETRS